MIRKLLLLIWVLFTMLLFTPLIVCLIDGLLFVFDFKTILNYTKDSKFFLIWGLTTSGSFSLLGLAYHTDNLL